MPTLTMLRGLPASGKTKYAKQYIKDNPKKKIIRVNKDDMRDQYFGGEWTDAREHFVIQMRDEAVYRGLARGYDVIVDDTNLAPQHEKRLKEIALENRATFEVKEFDILLRDALDRNALRETPVPANVIHGMWRKSYMPGNRYLGVGMQSARGLPSAIICDIDGTIAHPVRSDHYATDEKLLTDEPQLHVINVVKAVAREKHLFFLSGRSEDGRKFTEQWLDPFFALSGKIMPPALLMRASGDSRRDSIVKRELYETHLKGKYNVIAVFDDRNQVIRECWEPLGLPVFKVGHIDDEF